MSNPREDELLFAIGWMADSFARLEGRVIDCFSRLVNPQSSRVGELISDRISLNQTISLIGDLLKDCGDSDAREAFTVISKDVQRAVDTRNDIMHSSWATPSADDIVECEIIQERARKRHLRPDGYVLEELLAKMEEGTFFIQEVEMKVLAFSKRYLERSSKPEREPDT